MVDESCNPDNCFLYKYCIPEWRELIDIKRKMVHFKKGASIFKEGDKVNGIYFLYSGAAKVHKQWVAEKELIIRFSREGDILGHRGFGTSEFYPVSATALTPSKACFITNNFLETILRADHALTFRLMQFYSLELQKAEMRMRNLALMEVKGRIAETLLEILEVFGTDKDGHIAVPITRQDIAAYSGTTYETVFKFLKLLTKAKTISSVGKSIKINDEKKLRGILKNAN